MATYLSSVLAACRPLQGITSRRHSSPPPVSEEDARCFCASLSEDLAALERSLGEGSVTFRWSADAIRVLRRTQAALLALLRRSGLPMSLGVQDGGWFDLYMEETAALLDLCNRLRSVAAAISRYRMVVDLAVQKIQNGGPAPELEALEAEHQKLLEATRRRETTNTTTVPDDPEQIGRSAAGVAMLAARSATVAISLILVSAFVSPISVDIDGERVARKFPQLGPLAGSLASLVGRFRERYGAGVALAEHELVRDSVRDLRWRLEPGRAGDAEELGRCVDVLRRRSEVLKEGIEVFDAGVGEMFDEMIKGRNELLTTFRDGALK